jgi:hypothetical protein
MTLVSLWATMVTMHRFRWLAVVAVTLVVFGVSLAALLKGPSYTSPASAAPTARTLAALAAGSATQFVQHTVGLVNSNYPSFWTNTMLSGPHESEVTTGKVVVRGNCAAVDFEGNSGRETAFIRHPHLGGQWIPERIIPGGGQFRNLNSAAKNCS